LHPEGGNDSYYVNQTVNFEYIPDDDEELVNCSLITDSETRRTNECPRRGEVDRSFNWTFDDDGRHTWKVVCYDNKSASNEDDPESDIIIQKDERPIVILVSPPDDSELYVNQTIEFVYIPADDCELASCVLLIEELDDIEQDRNESPKNGSENHLRASIPAPGNYTWNVTCWDVRQKQNSSVRSISIGIPDNVCVYENGTSWCDAEGFNLNYTNISDAIRDVLPGGNITVMPGNYTENLVIDKPLALIGVGEEKPVIYSEGKYIVEIISSGVTLDGFNITGVYDGEVRDKPSGIYAHRYLDNIIIYNNTILTKARHGMIMFRVLDPVIANNSIKGFTNNGDNYYSSIGIYLCDCSGNGYVFNNEINCVDGRNSCGIVRSNSSINCGNGTALRNCNQIDCGVKVRDV
jgi:hypothetical protein